MGGWYAVSMSALTTSFWCPFYLPATALAPGIGPGEMCFCPALFCHYLGFAFMVFCVRLMKPRWRGKWLAMVCVCFFLSEGGIWELEVGSKATLWGGSIKRKAISAFCLPAWMPSCLFAIKPSSHPAILPVLTVVELSATKMDVAIFIKGARKRKLCGCENAMAEICVQRSGNIRIWIKFMRIALNQRRLSFVLP